MKSKRIEDDLEMCKDPSKPISFMLTSQYITMDALGRSSNLYFEDLENRSVAKDMFFFEGCNTIPQEGQEVNEEVNQRTQKIPFPDNYRRF